MELHLIAYIQEDGNDKVSLALCLRVSQFRSTVLTTQIEWCKIGSLLRHHPSSCPSLSPSLQHERVCRTRKKGHAPHAIETRATILSTNPNYDHCPADTNFLSTTIVILLALSLPVLHLRRSQTSFVAPLPATKPRRQPEWKPESSSLLARLGIRFPGHCAAPSSVSTHACWYSFLPQLALFVQSGSVDCCCSRRCQIAVLQLDH